MNSTQAPALRQLESATSDFRDRLAREHRARWVAESRRADAQLDRWDPTLLPGEKRAIYDAKTGEIVGMWRGTDDVSDAMQDALSVAKWHQGRDNGQKYRFKKLGQCGSRMVIAQCRACETDRKPVAEGCGIARLCERCSLLNAKRRRARFGRARARVSIDLQRIGYTRTRRKHGASRTPGGMWSDKMITLTVPHFLLCHVDEKAELRRYGKARATDPTMARIYAVRAAWPLFARALRRWFKLGGEVAKRAKRKRREKWVPPQTIAMPLKDGTFVPPPMHRAFEWTPGKDGLGHPHFHVWMLGPHVPGETVAAMWRDALIAVGVPIAADAHVQVEIKRFRDFNGAAVGELVKGGNRKALEWSRLFPRGKGPKNVFEYADGWTIAEALHEADPPVLASLYIALEGSRLTQASRGFFEADDPPACEECKAQGCWHVRFEAAPETKTTTATTNIQPTGPP